MLYIVPRQRIYVFRTILTINSNYFLKSINILVFLKEITVFSVRYSACGVCGGESATGTGFFFFENFCFPPVNIILHLHIALTRKTYWQNLAIFQKAAIFRKSESIG